MGCRSGGRSVRCRCDLARLRQPGCGRRGRRRAMELARQQPVHDSVIQPPRCALHDRSAAHWSARLCVRATGECSRGGRRGDRCRRCAGGLAPVSVIHLARVAPDRVGIDAHRWNRDRCGRQPRRRGSRKPSARWRRVRRLPARRGVAFARAVCPANGRYVMIGGILAAIADGALQRTNCWRSPRSVSRVRVGERGSAR